MQAWQYTPAKYSDMSRKPGAHSVPPGSLAGSWKRITGTEKGHKGKEGKGKRYRKKKGREGRSFHYCTFSTFSSGNGLTGSV